MERLRRTNRRRTAQRARSRGYTQANRTRSTLREQHELKEPERLDQPNEPGKIIGIGHHQRLKWGWKGR